MPGNSSFFNARGVTKGCSPLSVSAWPVCGAMALGATGNPPSGWKLGCEMRPMCQS
jgi:hypothetical protein